MKKLSLFLGLVLIGQSYGAENDPMINQEGIDRVDLREVMEHLLVEQRNAINNVRDDEHYGAGRDPRNDIINRNFRINRRMPRIQPQRENNLRRAAQRRKDERNILRKAKLTPKPCEYQEIGLDAPNAQIIHKEADQVKQGHRDERAIGRRLRNIDLDGVNQDQDSDSDNDW